MQEKTENTNGMLQAKDMDEQFSRLAPLEWQNLPMATQANTITQDVFTGAKTHTQAVVFAKQCNGVIPTDEEALEVINSIKSKGEPVLWLSKLCYIDILHFPEGTDEPTVKELLENGTHSKAETRALIVSYPHFIMEQT